MMKHEDWVDVQPRYGADAFECPYCHVYATQLWAPIGQWGATTEALFWNGWKWSECLACHHAAIWAHSEEMIFPFASGRGPDPDPDMPGVVLTIYEEARAVYPISPRACAALLRLALRVLIDSLEPGPKSVNTKIARLVKRGLDPKVQHALTASGVAGSKTVQPGEVLLEDDALVPVLFDLLNLVVHHVLSHPKQVAALLDSLPKNSNISIAQQGTVKAITAGEGGSGNPKALPAPSSN